MAWVAVAVVGSSVINGIVQSDAAGNAADAQRSASNADIAERQRQFDAIQKLLAPYVSAGSWAVSGQRDLTGLNGQRAQQNAINAIQNGPEFTSMVQQGQDAILQNASATGGLRGGNTQAALAQFRPALLSQLIAEQYNRLGGLSSLGQNAAAGVGNAGLSTANGIGGALQQAGAASAGAYLADGRAISGGINGLASGVGMWAARPGTGNVYTTPDLSGAYANPAGSVYDYRGSMLPDALRGGF